jgi:uridine phosphorylase
MMDGVVADPTGTVDILYHLGLDTTMDLSLFQDVRFVCMGGSAVRAASFAEDLRKKFCPETKGPPEPVGKTERYSIYKVGQIISCSHGIGMPSMLILMHEMAKLLHYAGAQDVAYIRIGTSGGIGLDPGTVVVTTCGCMGTLELVYEAIELGERRRYGAQLDATLVPLLLSAAKDIEVPAQVGLTMGTDDFYEAQGRLDGALRSWYTEEDKMKFLNKAYNAGVRNIEMEACGFGAFCQRAGIRGAIVCATLVNRLQGDQVTSTPEQLGQFSLRAQRVVAHFMEKELSKVNGESKQGVKRAREE